MWIPLSKEAGNGAWVKVTHEDGVCAHFGFGEYLRNPPARSARRVASGSGDRMFEEYIKMSLSTPSSVRDWPWRRLLVPALLTVALFWAFASTLGELLHRWSQDPQYSHGYLVPAFAGVLLWLRRERCAGFAPRASWWGLLLFAFGLAIRFAGNYLYLDWLDSFALLPCLAGLTILLGGKAAFSWAWPAILFLGFMIPLPYTLEIALAHPLQRVATISSTYALQTLGFPALAQGNVIQINQTRIGVVEACSGLSMLVIFFAISTAFSVLAPGPLWQKLLLAASAVPIALIANITRITVTGVMHETVGHKAADLVFHDLAGWLMMPFALILLWLELKVLALRSAEVKPVAAMVVIPTGVSRAMAAYKSKNRR